MALAIRVGIKPDDMKQMSYVSLMNILISTVERDEEKQATQEDIERFFG